MPSTLITVALNTKQSQKCPLLVPSGVTFDPTEKQSCRHLVLKAAESKLRLKRGTRIFVQRGGKELRTEQDWRECIANEVVLLVSKGEEYIGRTEAEAAAGRLESAAGVDVDARPNPDCPVHLLAQASDVDAESDRQLATAAHTLPGLIYAVGQPDLHPGNKYPIGSVFISRGWIHPPLIGSDIGCGMAYFRVHIKPEHLDGDKGRRVAESLRGLEGEWKSQKERAAWLSSYGIEVDIESGHTPTEEFDKSLGTIGAGNHFAELQVVEDAPEPSALLELSELRKNEVLLLVHSGSRGFGGSVLKRYTLNGHESFPATSQEAREYLAQHDIACKWANANRDLIALRFLSRLEPGDVSWSIGDTSGASTWKREIEDEVSRAQAALHCRKIVDIWHNSVEHALWPPPKETQFSTERDPVRGHGEDTPTPRQSQEQEYVFIHRKGAAPTYNPKFGVPLHYIPLPGSRGTPTLVMRPTFLELNKWGATNGLSLAHGAGRSMSRSKALQSLMAKYKDPSSLLRPSRKRQLSKHEENRYFCEGSWVVCDNEDLVWEEAPEAYKNVVDVGEDLVAAGAAEILAWCSPRVSYKMRRDY